MSWRALLAGSLAAVFLALALLHVRWAVARPAGAAAPVLGRAVVPTRPDGTPLFAPSRRSTWAVALALTLAAVVALAQGQLGWHAPAALRPAVGAAAWVLAAVLLLRAVGDFRYVGLGKRVRGTPFAELDTRYYTPLCAALAAGVAYLAAT